MRKFIHQQMDAALGHKPSQENVEKIWMAQKKIGKRDVNAHMKKEKYQTRTAAVGSKK